jgi:beta-fructofuranosidase
MFHSRGSNPSELGDIEVICHEGVLHLFHLVIPSQDLVAHATSSDGLSWDPAPPALRTGDPGDCDDDQIWTMQVVKKPDDTGFYMYYTGCATAEHGQVQRVALAESDDLMTWHKYSGNPILESKNPHYNEDIHSVGFISFRDPFVFIEEGLWHMLVVAREAKGPRFRRGCIAHATSKDGVSWQLQKPIYAPQTFEDLEVPSLLKLENRFYLFFNDFDVGNILYRVADALEGPWRVPLRDQLLTDGNLVARFCRWNGKLLLYNSLQAEADWPRRRGIYYTALMPPKELSLDVNGEVRLSSFSGWSAYFRGEPQRLCATDFNERTTAGEGWAQDADGNLSVNVCGGAMARTTREFDDVIIEFSARMDEGRRCGLVLRCDETFDIAVWVHLNFVAQQVELHRTRYFDSSLHRYKLLKPTVIKAAPVALTYAEEVRVRVLACREYIEVSINGEVLISAVTYQTTRGQIALWVEDGEVRFSPMQTQCLKQPR